MIAFFQYILYFLDPFVINFRDMQQTVFSRQDFNKSTERHNRFYNTVVHLTNFRFSDDSPNPCQRLIDRFLIGSRNVDNTFITNFFNIDGST